MDLGVDNGQVHREIWRALLISARAGGLLALCPHLQNRTIRSAALGAVSIELSAGIPCGLDQKG